MDVASQSAKQQANSVRIKEDKEQRRRSGLTTLARQVQGQLDYSRRVKDRDTNSTARQQQDNTWTNLLDKPLDNSRTTAGQPLENMSNDQKAKSRKSILVIINIIIIIKNKNQNK